MKDIDKIKVMQAFEKGKKIKCRLKDDNEWFENPSPAWNWELFDYEIINQGDKLISDREIKRRIN